MVMRPNVSWLAVALTSREGKRESTQLAASESDTKPARV